MAEIGPSLWSLKPWWCQPWSILLTGALVGVGSGLVSSLVLHHWWLALPVCGAVLLWWWLFLVLAPAAYRRQVGGEPLRPPAA